MTPQEYCQNKTASSGSSFYYSFLFLPPDQRLAITALYAFCREADDIVDECQDTAVAEKKLQWWRDEIDQLLKTGAEDFIKKPFDIAKLIGKIISVLQMK